MISLIVAHDINGVIGNGPDIPWHLPADFQYFKKTTLGHPIIMGRTTFESIGKPLPGRLNIVVTQDKSYKAEGVFVASSVEDAVKLGEQEKTGEVFVIGGAQIYRYALENNLIDQVYVTHINTQADGDVLFPVNLISEWKKISSVLREKDEKNEYDMEFLVYKKSVIVNGKKIAAEVEERLEEQVQQLNEKPSLGIYVVGDNKATVTYVKKKRELAERIGVNFYEFLFESDITEDELIEHITNHKQNVDGIVIQLPLPSHIDSEKLCNLIPSKMDPDMLNAETMKKFIDGDMSLLPPVTSAIDEIIAKHKLDIVGKKVLVIGKGKLVGAPAIAYFTHKGAEVTAVDKTDKDFADIAKQADIVVSGAGVSGLVTPDMLQEGVVLFDAGTSGSSGSLQGDIDWECEKKATLFSRSPGGIGPLTVVSLFKNFISLVENK